MQVTEFHIWSVRCLACVWGMNEWIILFLCYTLQFSYFIARCIYDCRLYNVAQEIHKNMCSSTRLLWGTVCWIYLYGYQTLLADIKTLFNTRNSFGCQKLAFHSSVYYYETEFHHRQRKTLSLDIRNLYQLFAFIYDSINFYKLLFSD